MATEDEDTRHLLLEDRKLVFSRIAILEVIEKNALGFAEKNKIDSLDLMRRAAIATTSALSKENRLSLPVNPETDRLDKHYVTLLEQMENLAKALSRPALTFVNSAIPVNCNRCAAREPGEVPCSSRKDSQKLTNGGECLVQLQLLFDFALSITRNIYLRLGVDLSKCSVIFSTRSSSSKPNDIPGEFFVGGSTSYQAVDQRPRSVITLTINPEKYQWNCYLGSLYVLFHEIWVHAFQGICSSTGHCDRTPARPDEMFSEGWMDSIGVEVLTEALKYPGTEDPPFVVSWKDKFIDNAQALHRERKNFTAASLSNACYPAARAMGDDARKRLEHFFFRCLGDKHKAWECVLQLSVKLNQTTNQTKAREIFIRCVQSFLCLSGGVESPQSLDFSKILKAYIKSEDTDQLLNDCSIQWRTLTSKEG